MKKIIISALALVGVTNLTSCDDFLTVNPVDKQVKESYYTSAESVRANTASLYGLAWWDFTNRFMYQAGDMLSGDLWYTYGEEGQFYYNTVRPENLYSEQGWNGLFRVISYANSIIDDMPTMARENNISEDVIQGALGEAYLFRGIAYYYLAEYWGEVPIIERPTDLITSGDASTMYLNKNTQSSIYRFVCEDLERAQASLPMSDEPGRATYYSATGLLAKVYLTRGCYEKNQEYFTKAKELAAEVITNGPKLHDNFATMFDVSDDNCSESLLAIQCIVGGYGYGNDRSIEWGRRDALTGVSCWGSGKCPTLSLKELFEEHPGDGRRQWTYMQQGDKYPLLNNYEYNIYYSEKEDYSVWLDKFVGGTCAHIKKYVINSDGGTNIGTSQDGANNLYLLRVADVYFVYAEACLAGDINGSLTDETAIGYINEVLNRGKAGYTVSAPLSYIDIIKERRREFAFESISWFDIKRLSYLDETQALDYINGMYRDKVMKFDYARLSDELGLEPGANPTNEQLAVYGNNMDYYYRSWDTEIDTEAKIDAGLNSDINTENRAAAIVFTPSAFHIAIPANATTNAPILLEPAVDYYQE